MSGRAARESNTRCVSQAGAGLAPQSHLGKHTDSTDVVLDDLSIERVSMEFENP